VQGVCVFKLHVSYLLNRCLRGALRAYVMKGGGGSTFLAIVTSSLVIHLTSVSIISYAESNGGIFVLIGRIKPKIRRSKKSIVRVRD
jgi:hypothetical protein